LLKKPGRTEDRVGVDEDPHTVPGRRSVDPEREIHHRAQGGDDLVDWILTHRHRRSVGTDEAPCGVDGDLSAHLLGREAQQLAGGRVAEDDARVRRVNDDSGVQALDQRSVSLFALPELAFGPLALPDVLHHDREILDAPI
jgi:hypothetical protein